MLQAGVGCELDSRSVERIVDHSALPDSPAQTPQSPVPRSSMDRPSDKNRPMPNGVPNGHFRNNSMVNSPIRAYQVIFPCRIIIIYTKTNYSIPISKFMSI